MRESPLATTLAVCALGAAVLGVAVAFWILLGLALAVDLAVFFVSGTEDDGPR